VGALCCMRWTCAGYLTKWTDGWRIARFMLSRWTYFGCLSSASHCRLNRPAADLCGGKELTAEQLVR